MDDAITAHTTDEVLEALDAFVETLQANSERNRIALERARVFRSLREQGLAYSEIVTSEVRPLMVELATDNLDALCEAGGRFRRAQAHALHAEGMTMERIASLFGVTRQRVSMLLRHRNRTPRD